MTNTTTIAKKQWQKPNFYLLDSTNIKAFDKTSAFFKEHTMVYAYKANGHPYGQAQKAVNPNDFYAIDNYVS